MNRILFAIGVLTVSPALAEMTRGPFLQNVGADHITICWETAEPARATVTVTDDAGKKVASAETPSANRRHEIVIPDLLAGRTYRYEVAVENDSAREKGTFRTAPPPGAPFTFAAWGDSRSNPKMVERLAGVILRSGAMVSVHSGDLVHRGSELHEWNEMFFGPCRELLRNVPLFATIGNHDRGPLPESRFSRKEYTEALALPGNERYYSFDYGDAHFLVLDTNSDAWDDDEQFEFARRDLAATGAKWRFVVWHHPVFSTGGHTSEIGVRTKYCPLLARYNVDMVICGHDHDFQLSRPILHRYEKQQRSPYIHLVAGGGGANLHQVHEDALWFGRGRSFHHVVVCSVDGDVMKCRVLDESGQVAEEFGIDKTKQPETTVAYELIELDRLYQELPTCDSAGKPAPVLLDPDTRAAKMHYRLTNPLPEPIKVTWNPGRWDGLAFPDGPQEVRLEAGASKVLSVPLAITDAANVRALEAPFVQLETPIGNAKTTLPLPPLACRKAAPVAALGGEIVVDGSDSDVAWRSHPAYRGFTRASGNALRDQDAKTATALRVARDGDTLYVLVQSPRGEKETLRIGNSPAGSDAIALYFAGDSSELRLAVDPRGRLVGAAPEGVKIAARAGDRLFTCEVAVPLRLITQKPDGGSVLFNAIDRRDRTEYAFSPTFGRAPDRDNSAKLMLE